jgi:hypothetical protein
VNSKFVKLLIESRLKELLISARNNFVKNLLVTHYATQPQSRQIDILCVSNTLYREGRKRQQMQARRESLTASDRIQAGEQMLASSRIDELRNFCQGIPLQSQIAEARHFLKTRLRTLLEKTELWLTASVPDIVADQQATPGFIEVLQNELRTVSFSDLTRSRTKSK